MQQQAERTGFSTMAEIMPGRPITDADLPDRPTVREVADWLNKSINTIYLWARKGLIPCKRVGRSYIFDKAALLKWARPEQEASNGY